MSVFISHTFEKMNVLHQSSHVDSRIDIMKLDRLTKKVEISTSDVFSVLLAALQPCSCIFFFFSFFSQLHFFSALQKKEIKYEKKS